jgi:hypothetical protein
MFEEKKLVPVSIIELWKTFPQKAASFFLKEMKYKP